MHRFSANPSIGWKGSSERNEPAKLPVVLTKEEVRAVLRQLEGAKWLMASLLYGAGLRLMECLRLRVKDLDFGYSQVVVRDGKGQKDRVTVLSDSLKEPPKRHLEKVKALHQQDLKEGFGEVAVALGCDAGLVPGVSAFCFVEEHSVPVA
jgi:integrase